MKGFFLTFELSKNIKAPSCTNRRFLFGKFQISTDSEIFIYTIISNETVLLRKAKTYICWKTECEHVQITRSLINSVSNLSACLQTNGPQRQARVYSRVYLASYRTYLCTVTALFRSNRSINDYFIDCGSLKFLKYKSAICAGRGFKFT